AKIEGVFSAMGKLNPARHLFTLRRGFQSVSKVSLGQGWSLEGAHLAFLACLVTIDGQDGARREADRKNDGFLLLPGLGGGNAGSLGREGPRQLVSWSSVRVPPQRGVTGGGQIPQQRAGGQDQAGLESRTCQHLDVLLLGCRRHPRPGR